MRDSTGMARIIVRATAVPFGAVGFDALLAAAITAGDGRLLLRALILMGIATALLWGSDRL